MLKVKNFFGIFEKNLAFLLDPWKDLCQGFYQGAKNMYHFAISCEEFQEGDNQRE